MRLNDWKADAQRFESIDRAVMRGIERGTESTEAEGAGADGGDGRIAKGPLITNSTPATLEARYCARCRTSKVDTDPAEPCPFCGGETVPISDVLGGE